MKKAKPTTSTNLALGLCLFALTSHAQVASEQKQDIAAPVSTAAAVHQFSPGVGEVLRMVQSGVSREVVQTYIGQSTNAIYLSASDLVALKEKAVPDEVTIALLKRGAELAANIQASGPGLTASATSTVQIPARVSQGIGNPAYLDPESYSYFQYYYLYPRTLASVNERMLSSYVPYWGAAAGPFYGPTARRFHSQSFGRFGP